METVNDYQETDLGNVAPNPKGEYSDTADYEYLDLVTYSGGSYLCINETGMISGITPEAGRTTAYWQLVALPGELTPEYIAMHDDVVNKAASAAEDAAQTSADRNQVESMKENVSILQEQVARDTQSTKEYKESAGGYASIAEESRNKAQEAETNARALVDGFDSHVEEKKQDAQEDIADHRKTAVQAVASQQVLSTNAVKAEGDKAMQKTSEDAKATAADRDAIAEMANKIDSQSEQISQDAAQVAADKAKAAESATVAAESEKKATAAADSLESTVEQVETNRTKIADLDGNKANGKGISFSLNENGGLRISKS